MTEAVPPGSPPAARRWLLVAPGPAEVQGRPDLYWNEDDWEWVECPDEATEYAERERAAVDLATFDGAVEWRERQAS